MKIEDLLTMRSGLDWVEADATYNELYTSSRDWVKFVLDLPMSSDPGTKFLYSSGNSIVLAAIIQRASGKDLYQFAKQNLFDPIGIRDPRWDRDPSGLPIGGWGLQLTPREMAKLGYLYLHDGAWDGKQVVPASWVRASTTPHITTTERLNYGYQWWIDATIPLYAALGRFGQSISVVAERDLVVVFTGAMEPNEPEADVLLKGIVSACGEE
jgi:CubicO group peptidase (beta-lactamase class C family)